MAVLTLPVVIVATEEALRAVPRELREASLALGATKFQTVFNVVVPAGELRHPDRHHPGGQPRRGRGGAHPVHGRGLLPAAACPAACRRSSCAGYHVYVLSTQSPDVDATKPILYATVLVLLVLTFALNIAAVVVRARMRRRNAGGAA